MVPVIIVAILASVTSVCLYDMYLGVEVSYENTNSGATRMSTNINKTGDSIEDNIEDIIENASKSIVRNI